MWNKVKNNIKGAFKDNKNLIIISTIIFIVTLFLGYFLNAYLYNYLNSAVNELYEGVSSGAIKITFQTIFLNNISIVFRLFILGILFCFSIVILAYNGFFLGYFIADYNNLVHSVLFIIPHGIFELPAIILANAAGLVLFKYFFSVFTLKNSNLEDKSASYVDRLYESLFNNGKYLNQALILLLISIILIAIAAFIEVYITTILANYFIMLLGI